MKLRFLGTGTSQGVPVIGCTCPVCTSLDFRDKRLRTSVHLEVEGKSFVVDTGPDFRQQMLRERIMQLDAILFTHEHKDHTAGMDDVRAYNFRQKKDMPLYARRQVIEQLKQEFSYAFSEKKYPGVPQLQINEIDNAPFMVEGVKIIPIEVMHYRLPVLGFRVGNLSYITDANQISEHEMEKLEGTEVMVLNALQKDQHISHYNLEEALQVAQRIGATKTYFTHISHRMGLHARINEELPDGIELAYDGLQIDL